MTRNAATTALGTSLDVNQLAYDRSEQRPGIVHIGVGRFHRAHLAAYVDQLMELGLGKPWAIRGVGLRPEDESSYDALSAQGCLYSVTEKRPDGSRVTRVVGSLVDYVDGWRDREAAIEAVADPHVKIASLTITEGGYNIDHQSGEFLLDTPEVAQDIAAPGAPRTVFGVVTEGLRRRRDRGYGPLTVLSCDNVQGNGVVARRAFTTFAGAVDGRLAEWISEQVSFPSSMVDRITPTTTREDGAELFARTGLLDNAAVVCEPFRQFVIEDDFVAGRPPWERVGVQMVSDVQPYEQMKLRLLNAPHQILAHFGLLAGYTHTAEAMRDESLVELVRAFQRLEALPTMPEVPGVDIPSYVETVLERFGNPQMDDTLVRIATSASARIPAFVLPVVWDNLHDDGPLTIAAATVAAWLHRLVGAARDGSGDCVPDEAVLVIPGSSTSVRTVLSEPLFGGLRSEARFVDACLAAAATLGSTDVATAMRAFAQATSQFATP
jgi:mannitol 2-dehydrogenase